MTNDLVVSFYQGSEDDRGRTLAEILDWPDLELELRHDYIQWIFPTEAPSAVNPWAPLVTPATAAAFAAQPDLRERLRQSLDRMLKFYGLRRSTSTEGSVTIERDPERFEIRAGEWLHAGSHDHLRLTRIMKSLASLGLDAEARALQRCLLEDIYDGPGSTKVSRETYEFWLAALRP